MKASQPTPRVLVTLAAMAATCVTLVGARPAIAVQLAFDGGVVSASEDGAVLWTRMHAGTASRGGARARPIASGALAAYATDDSLYMVDARDGRVINRVTLPDDPGGLTFDGDAVLVRPPRRGWGGGANATYRVWSDGDDVPFVSAVPHAVALADDADAFVLAELARHAPTDAPTDVEGAYADPAWRASLQAALPAMRAEAARDRTTPWMDVAVARAELALGRRDAATAALERALSIDPRWGEELVRASAVVARLPLDGADALSVAMLERGLGGMLRAGFDPGSACTPQMADRPPNPHEHSPLSAPGGGRLETAEQNARRAWALYPLCNEIDRTFLGLARGLEALDQPHESAIWLERAARSHREAAVVGPIAQRPERDNGPGARGRAAAIAAFAALMLVLIDQARARRLAMAHPRATRMELLAVVGLSLVVTRARDEVPYPEIARIEVPVASWVGAPGAPQLEPVLEAASHVPGGEFTWGWHLLHAGDLERADAVVAALDDPRALANRGVIAARRGDAEGAAEMWRAALASDPSIAEAAWNLGAPPTSILTERYAEHDVQRPVPIPPTRAMAEATWLAIALSDTLGAEPAHADEAIPFDTRSAGPDALFMVVGLLCLAAVAGWRSSAGPPTPRPRFDLIGVLVPGAAVGLRGARPLVLFAFVAAAQAASAMAASDGTTANPFDLYEGPKWPLDARGALIVEFDEAAPVPWLAHVWLAIWLTNAALLTAHAVRRTIASRSAR